MTEKKYFT